MRCEHCNRIIEAKHAPKGAFLCCCNAARGTVQTVYVRLDSEEERARYGRNHCYFLTAIHDGTGGVALVKVDYDCTTDAWLARNGELVGGCAATGLGDSITVRRRGVTRSYKVTGVRLDGRVEGDLDYEGLL